jgi:hypothetical protein
VPERVQKFMSSRGRKTVGRNKRFLSFKALLSVMKLTARQKCVRRVALLLVSWRDADLHIHPVSRQ